MKAKTITEATNEELTFDQLVDRAALNIGSAFLLGGGKEMKSAIHVWMSNAILWSQSKEKDQPRP